MADFSINTDTSNNPQDWFGQPYAFTSSLFQDIITIDVKNAMAATGVTADDLSEPQGDVRAVYLALAEALWQAYDAKDDDPSTSSSRLKMLRSHVVDETNNIRHTTYTIHVQEDGAATSQSFVSTGVRAE